MAAGKDHRAVHEIIEAEREAYLDALPPPDPTWPPDVRIVYADLCDHLFDLGLRIKDVKQRCGLYDHNISTRFAYWVGECPKAYMTKHQLTLAKHLLQDERLKHVRILQIAQTAGYESQSGFANTFKRNMGCTPSAYRKHHGRRM